MAYIKIFPIKSTVKKTVAYITNPDKTDEQNLVSSFGCSPETADLEFAMTAEMGKNNVMEKGDNLAWHMIISYHPNDLTDPKLAHEVSTKIADSVLKGKYALWFLRTYLDDAWTVSANSLFLSLHFSFCSIPYGVLLSIFFFCHSVFG